MTEQQQQKTTIT